jgi:glucose/arabinose dehydrogenase
MGRCSSVLLLVVGVMVFPVRGQAGVRAQAAPQEEEVVRCRACWITAFAFTPDGSEIFYAERFSGEIRRMSLETGEDVRWARIRGVARGGERGVLGLALDPGWLQGSQHERVYVYFTQAEPERNLIVRVRKGAGRVHRLTLATVPASPVHNGGPLHFGPDGKLYAVTGDAGSPALSQRRSTLAGKVLRMNQNGSGPRTNPFRGRTYSYGHRNSFGFTWDPLTGRLWQTENGPECDDEINRIRSGRNYGWGADSSCPRTSESGPTPIQPVLRINPIVAPTGAAFCIGCGLAPQLDGDLLVGTFSPGRILAYELGAARKGIVGRSVVLNRNDAVLAMESAPDGSVYFSDVRGIYRLS